VAQAQALGEVTADKPIHVVIDLDVPREIVLERLSSRRVCRDCGTNYTTGGSQPSPWICDVCGGDVQQRADDTPESVSRRLDLYEEQTAPLIAYYSSRTMLTVVNGVGHPDHVFKRLTDAIEARR
jgi:adenylate kinase